MNHPTRYIVAYNLADQFEAGLSSLDFFLFEEDFVLSLLEEIYFAMDFDGSLDNHHRKDFFFFVEVENQSFLGDGLDRDLEEGILRDKVIVVEEIVI